MSEDVTLLQSVRAFCRRHPVRIAIIGGTFGYTTCKLISSHVASPGQVNGRSMQPTFNPWIPKRNEVNTQPISFLERLKSTFTPCYDWVLLRPVRDYSIKFKPGEIVTLINPMDGTSRDIKRVIAVEGQAVVTRSYKNAVVVVPKGHLWVEGDNHALSKDSNSYGPIPIGLVKCRATHILIPLRRAGRLDATTIPPRPHKKARAVSDIACLDES